MGKPEEEWRSEGGMKGKILHTPEGVRDFYGDECERKKALEACLFQVMDSYGYRAIETPAFEYFDVYGQEVGTIPSRDLYKFFDREGNTLVLRPDFTPSIARAASRYFQDSGKPVRLSYLGHTYVNQSNLTGKLKENTQLGAELIGGGTVDDDAEIIALATEALLASGLKEFQISVGHVRFFESLAEEAGFDRETTYRLRDLIHNRNTFGTLRLLREEGGNEQISDLIARLPQMNGGREVLETAFEMSEGLKAQAESGHLLKVYDLLKLYGLQKHISFDLGMLSAYMYYTGIIFRGYTYGTGEAVVKGGRYDELLSHFGSPRPAVGFVVVTNQLMNALERQKIQGPPLRERNLILYTEKNREEAHSLAVIWRKEGRSVELCLSSDCEMREIAERLKGSGEYSKIIQVKEK